MSIDNWMFNSMPAGESEIWERATAALNSENFEEAINSLKQLAAEGDWRAATALGAIFESRGSKDPKCYVQAAHWYSNALAKEDRPEPNLGLARYYYYGLGGYYDFVRAYEHLKKAYLQTNHEAALMMAEILFHGAGVQRDLKQSEKLFRAASDAGYPYGFVGLARIQKARGQWISTIAFTLKAVILAVKLVIREKNSVRLLGLGKKRGRLALDGVVANKRV